VWVFFGWGSFGGCTRVSEPWRKLRKNCEKRTIY